MDYISFSFYVKYIWKKCYKNFLGAFFLGANTVQTVPKHIWIQQWPCRNQSTDLQNKSIYWFPYDWNLHHERVNDVSQGP